jgi:hypothetical protein
MMYLSDLSDLSDLPGLRRLCAAPRGPVRTESHPDV